MNSAREILTAHKLENTFWGKKIIAAENRGRFTESNQFAGSRWTTCACGKLDDGIPREDGGGDDWAPEDDDLYRLGLLFSTYVDMDEDFQKWWFSGGSEEWARNIEINTLDAIQIVFLEGFTAAMNKVVADYEELKGCTDKESSGERL